MKYIISTVLFLIVIFGVGACTFNGIHYETSKGEHTGFVTSVERTGLIWKTGKAYIKTDVSSSQEDTYCVMDQEVYAQLEQAAKDRKKVTIKFLDYLTKGFRNCDGEPAVIYSVN